MVNEKAKEIKPHHQLAIERAKSYMNCYFSNNISLEDISRYCYTSPFHFSRIFKKLTNHSPYQYLLSLRLQHAEFLLRNTAQPITDICFASGFNSLEHFATRFRLKYQKNPSEYRKFGEIRRMIYPGR